MNGTEVYAGISNMYNAGNLTGNGTMLTSSAINHAINTLIIISLLITMISLGCTMEISKIKAHLLKPKGVAIAMLAQFCIMPLTAFCLAKALNMNALKAVTVLVCGCCPGGTLSNIFALFIKGDMNLSIVMTTCSCMAALGLMPLLLYICSQGFPGLEKAVPYVGIITTLVLTLVPCCIGILINHKKPNYSPIITKVGLSIWAIVSILIAILSSIYVKNIIWMIFEPDMVIVAALMPMTGFMLGYIMSALCRLSPQCCRTISMETGFQNIQLCSTILKVAFPQELIGAMYLFPLLYITFQCTEAFFLAVCFRCYQTLKPHAERKCHSCLRVFKERSWEEGIYWLNSHDSITDDNTALERRNTKKSLTLCIESSAIQSPQCHLHFHHASLRQGPKHRQSINH